MAVKWAVANTAFTSAATWNDRVAPVDGDLCYLNGHTVTGTTGFYIGNGTISNDVCPNTGIGGGYISLTSGPMIITANVVCRGGMIIQCSGNTSFTLNGNIDSKNTPYVIYRPSIATVAGCTINGNIDSESQIFHNQNAAYNLTINGNAIINVTSYLRNATNLIVNGSLTLNDYVMNVLGDCSINGVLNSNYTNLICTNGIFTINGSINYKGNNIGVIANNFIVNNPDSFMWRDISEPRSNPFIILTNAEMNNRQQYPPEDEVKEGTEYVWGEKVGTYQAPPESVVLKDYVYDNGDKVGTLENQNIVGCVTKEDVREGVALIGMGEVGTLVVPSVDDVRDGVIFDNGSVGTLIVEGGGDRLRIADFGYYTNAQSDTYIVDLTEQDKPKFAVAEERVLIEKFPDLDLDNIPDKYFDDLFVKYLKYRLIVEYYRTAGINSTFTPSEPTTEIVNYRNVNCEIWMNIANTYLKAWGAKYPNSIKKQRVLL